MAAAGGGVAADDFVADVVGVVVAVGGGMAGVGEIVAAVGDEGVKAGLDVVGGVGDVVVAGGA